MQNQNILDAIQVPPVHKMLGGELLSWDKEQAELMMQYQTSPDFLNPAGHVQGGMICAMIDDAMGLFSLLINEDKFSVTVSFNMSFLRPCREGKVQVKVECIKNGQKIINMTGSAFQDERFVGQATAVFMPIETDTPIGRAQSA